MVTAAGVCHARSATPNIAAWLPLSVSLFALFLTMATFWWTNLRRGHLTVGYPRTYAATTREKTIVLLPLTLANTGPKPLGVRALRLHLAQAAQDATLHHVRTRTAMRLDVATTDFATNFIVEGRQTLLRLAEFQGEAKFTFRTGRVTGRLDVLYEDAEKWKALRTFELAVSAAAEKVIPRSYITYDNAELLPG